MISQEYREAVASRKNIRIRIMLKDSMLVDPTMKQFDEMLNYAKDNVDNLFDEHDGENLKYEKVFWNEEYLNDQMVKIVSNFSEDRIGLLRNIVKYLYSAKAENIRNEREQSSTESTISRKQIGIGVTAVGAITTVAGVAAAKGVLIVGGVVVTVAGVALILSDKER